MHCLVPVNNVNFRQREIMRTSYLMFDTSGCRRSEREPFAPVIDGVGGDPTHLTISWPRRCDACYRWPIVWSPACRPGICAIQFRIGGIHELYCERSGIDQ